MTTKQGWISHSDRIGNDHEGRAAPLVPTYAGLVALRRDMTKERQGFPTDAPFEEGMYAVNPFVKEAGLAYAAILCRIASEHEIQTRRTALDAALQKMGGLDYIQRLAVCDLWKAAAKSLQPPPPTASRTSASVRVIRVKDTLPKPGKLPILRPAEATPLHQLQDDVGLGITAAMRGAITGALAQEQKDIKQMDRSLQVGVALFDA